MNAYGKSTAAAVIAAAVAAGGCQSGPSKEQVGTVTGTIIGGAIGAAAVDRRHDTARTAAIIAGTAIGGMMGGAIGRTMDNQDRMMANQALETVPTHHSSTWQNPDTGHQYTMTPTRTYEATGSPCREYTMDAVIDGRVERVYGTACRQADGSWKVAD